MSKWLVTAIGLIVVAALMAIIVPRLVLHLALNELNESNRKVDVEDVRRDALADSAKALAEITRPELLLRLNPKDIQTLGELAVRVSAAAGAEGLQLSDVKVEPERQLIRIGARVAGVIAGTQITISGRLLGMIGVTFSGTDIVLHAAFDRIELDSINVPGWNWLPRHIVRIANPALAAELQRINGAIPVDARPLLPPPAPATSVRVGSRDIPIPAVAPRHPALLVDDDGLTVAVQVLQPLQTLTLRAGNIPVVVHAPPQADDAATVRAVGAIVAAVKASLIAVPTESGDFAAYRSAFDARVGVGFPERPIGSGLHLADVFLDDLLGPYRAPTGSDDEVRRISLGTNLHILGEMRGPDAVLRVPAVDVETQIAAEIKRALEGLNSRQVKILEPKQRLRNGAIEVSARIEADIATDSGKAITHWEIVVQAIPDGPVEGSTFSIVPRVIKFRLDGVEYEGRGNDWLMLLPAIGGFAENIRDTANRILPRIPIDIPIAPINTLDFRPFSFNGGTATVDPPQYTPSPPKIERVAVFITERGLWAVADVTAVGMPVRQAQQTPLPNVDEAETGDAFDKAISGYVKERIGDISAETLSAALAWRRFADLLNFAWASFSPRVSLSVDTDAVPLSPTVVRPMEYASFECHRIRQCDRKACRQRHCSFDGCSRDGCDSHCPLIPIQTCTPRICAFGGCVGGDCAIFGWTDDPGCVFQRQACNTAADLKYGGCQADANRRKAQCDIEANAELAACNLNAEADVAACNSQAEAEVALCEGKKALTNIGAETLSIGRISGDARLRANVSLDLRSLLVDPSSFRVALTPGMTGSVTANLGIEWEPLGVAGHVLVCPIRGKVFAETSARLGRPMDTVWGSFLPPETVPPLTNEATDIPFRFEIQTLSVRPGRN